MNWLLISPTAMGYLPIVVWHLVILGYLLSIRNKSRATWLFGGWLAALTLLNVSEFINRALYGISTPYLYWFGSIAATLADVTLELQFAYRYPRRLFRREAKIVLVICAAISLAMLALMISELGNPGEVGYAFTDFGWGVYLLNPFRLFLSAYIVGFLNPLGRVWLVGVWLREAIALSTPDPKAPARDWLSRFKQVARALWQPQGADAQFARNFGLFTIAAIVIVMSGRLGINQLLPVTSFPILYPLVLFAAVLVYSDHSPEPSTLMVRLVGISLVTLLVILGLVNPLLLDSQRDVVDRERELEVRQIRALVRTGQLDSIPDRVWYIAARPAAGGLLSSDYRILFSRGPNVQAQDLVAQDNALRAGLESGAWGDQVTNWIAHPEQLTRDGLGRLTIPDFVASYREAGVLPDAYAIRYDFHADDGQTIYEVGFNYLEYRELLHDQALPLVALTLGATLVILFVFPRFFQIGLVQPLGHLMAGMAKVNEGDLSVAVPVRADDEIGFLTRAFNTMVTSLRTLSASLEQRAADRARDLVTLYEVTALTNESADLQMTLDRALDKTLEVMNSQHGLLLLRGDDGTTLRLVAHRGFSVERMARMQDQLSGCPFLNRMLRTSQTVVVPNLLSDVPASHRDILQATPAYIGVPIVVKDQVLGGVVLFQDTLARFSADVLALLAAIAGQIGIAVESARLHERTEQAKIIEERQRLARDLHDSVTQMLYSTTLFAEASAQATRAGDVAQALHYQNRVSETAQRALREMRLLIYELRPSSIAQEGLIGALRRRLDAVERRAGIEVHLDAEEPLELPMSVEMELYRLMQEALNNSVKHSGATRISVRVGADAKGLQCEIADNGIGFDIATARRGAGIGLASMRERAERLGATLEILSDPGKGTRIQVVVPTERDT